MRFTKSLQGKSGAAACNDPSPSSVSQATTAEKAMIRSKALLTLFAALAAFGCAATVKNEQAGRHEVRRQGGAGFGECLAMIGTLPVWRLMTASRPRNDANPIDVLEIRPICAGMG